MSQKLELVREEKLFRLLPGRSEKSRLEASGVALLDEGTALVVFDNMNLVARIDLSLEPRDTNQLLPAPSLGLGFEDIDVDERQHHIFCLVESLADFDGTLHGFVAEYEGVGSFLRCTRLEAQFEKENKGFEGLTHAWLGEREFLYALCEGSGQIDVFQRAADGGWEAAQRIRMPKQARFDDYSAIAYRDGQVAVVSQESARVWVARIDEQSLSVVPDSGVVYRFPSKSYGNVEGIAWLTSDTLVAVSDRTKKGQDERSGEKDQSIHVFRIPAAE